MSGAEQTSLRDLVKQVRLADPTGTIYIGMYRAPARFAVREGTDFIYGLLGHLGREFVVIQTRYDDCGIDRKIPRELIYFVIALGKDMVEAASYQYQIALAVHGICQLSANAGAGVLKETLFEEFRFAEADRRYRKIAFDEIPRINTVGRFLDKIATLKLGECVWRYGERDRILLASSQYQEALRNWRPRSVPASGNASLDGG